MSKSQDKDLQIPPNSHEGQVCHREVSDERERRKRGEHPRRLSKMLFHAGGGDCRRTRGDMKGEGCCELSRPTQI